MKNKTVAILAYALTIAGVIALLLLEDPDFKLSAGYGILAAQALLLVSLFFEKKWDRFCSANLLFLILAALFTALYLGTQVTGVSLLFGLVIILASLVFLLLVVSKDWKDVRILDRFLGQKRR